MSGALAQDAAGSGPAEHLCAALDKALRVSPQLPASVRAALARLINVLQANADAVIFPVDATASAQQAAQLLGVSGMTVVRPVDRSELQSEEGVAASRCPSSPLPDRKQPSTPQSGSPNLPPASATDTPPEDVINIR